MAAETYHDKPCARCGTTERYTKSQKCVSCEKERARQWYKNNRSQARKRIREWQLSNPDKVKAQIKSWNERNPGKRNKIAQEWYNNDKHRTLKNNKRWASQNRDKVRSYKQKYRTSQTKAGGSFTEAEWKHLCALYGNKCLACGSPDDLCADHVIPVSKGGSSNISNIQPLCRTCNCSKADKTTDYRDKKFLYQLSLFD